MKKGLLHVYCGDGKGKTTAAAGLALRAAASGWRVLFVQFMKGGPGRAAAGLGELEGVRLLRLRGRFPFYREMTDRQKQEMTGLHNRMLDEIEAALETEEWDMLVLDEITGTCRYKLADTERVHRIVTKCRDRVELVCTGRDPEDFLLARADYITEMKNIRHPYERGVSAREGIEY